MHNMHKQSFCKLQDFDAIDLHSVYNLQSALCNLQSTMCNLQHALYNLQSLYIYNLHCIIYNLHYANLHILRKVIACLAMFQCS